MLAYRLLCLFLDCTKTDFLQRLHADLLEPPVPPGEPEPPPGGWPPPDPPPGGWPPEGPPPGEPEPPPEGWPPSEPAPPPVGEYLNVIGDGGGGLPGFGAFGLGLLEPGPPKPPPQTYIPGLAKIYSEPGDGYIRDSNSTWQLAHDNTDGDLISHDDTCEGIAIYSSNYEPAYGQIRRVFFTFDLSEIPASKTVTSAELWVYCHANDGINVTVQQSAHHQPLIKADYDAFSETYLARDTLAPGDNNFTFRPSGIIYLQSVLGGLAGFCLRQYDNDYNNVDPGPTTYVVGGLCFSEAAVEAQRPYLVVNYS